MIYCTLRDDYEFSAPTLVRLEHNAFGYVVSIGGGTYIFNVFEDANGHLYAFRIEEEPLKFCEADSDLSVKYLGKLEANLSITMEFLP
jgi:hypothetical protein